MSNYCLENEILNNGCICKQLVIRENLETKIIDDIINDFKYITENIEFDENINSSVDSSMKGETPDNAEIKEKFDSTVKKAKDLIPVLIDYKSKKKIICSGKELQEAIICPECNLEAEYYDKLFVGDELTVLVCECECGCKWKYKL